MPPSDDTKIVMDRFPEMDDLLPHYLNLLEIVNLKRNNSRILQYLLIYRKAFNVF